MQCFESELEVGGKKWISKMSTLMGAIAEKPKITSDLNELIRVIRSFYEDELGLAMYLDEDVDQDGEMMVYEVMELVLGCAVQCERKSEYITCIMEMEEEEVKKDLMVIIHDIMHRFPSMSPLKNSKVLDSPKFGFWKNSEDSAALKDKIRVLNGQLEKLMEENKVLVAKQEVHLDEMQRKNEVSSKHCSSGHERALEEKLNEMENLYNDNVVELKKVKAIQAEREEEFKSTVVKQADELDILRSKVNQIGKLENTINRYKMKLEQSSQLKTQMNEIEEQNQKYLEKILSLENTMKGIPMLKTTIEKYKAQVVDLETSNVDFSAKMDVKDKKLQDLQHELEDLSNSNEFLQNELETTQAQLSELDNADSLASNHQHAISGFDTTSNAELREKITRLEYERNTGTESNDSKVYELEHALDDVTQIKKRLEESNLELQQQKQILENQLSQVTKNGEREKNLKNTTSDKEEQVQVLQQQVQDLSLKLTSAETKAKVSNIVQRICGLLISTIFIVYRKQVPKFHLIQILYKIPFPF